MIGSIIQAHVLIKIKPSMSKQEKKRQRIYNFLNVEIKQKKPPKNPKQLELCLASIKLSP